MEEGRQEEENRYQPGQLNIEQLCRSRVEGFSGGVIG